MKILTVCNYGQVRSVTMANRLAHHANVEVFSRGIVNTIPFFLDKCFEVADLVVICNKPNIERNMAGDIPEEYQEDHLKPLKKYEDKVVVCDTIGFDRWGQALHPDLIEKCDEFIEKLKTMKPDIPWKE